VKSEEFKPNPDQLVSMKGVAADRTLREFEQILRFDFVVFRDGTVKGQLTFDRRHIHQPKLSKPMGYVWFSEYFQLLDLAKMFMTAAIVKSMISKYGTMIQPDSPIIEETIIMGFNSLVDLMKQDVPLLSRLYLKKVIEKIRELRGENVAK